MTWLDFVLAWLLLGFVNYGIKFLKYRNDWKKEGNQVFFVAVLVAALLFGPIGLVATLVRARGNPFKTVPTSISSADHPEAARVYDQGHEPRGFAEADGAAVGLLWRHRRTFAEEVAITAFAELHGRPPTDE